MSCGRHILNVVRAIAVGCAIAGAVMPVAAQNTLVVGAVRTPGGLDGDALRPATREVVPQIYEGLTRYPRTVKNEYSFVLDTSKVEPHLAERWTVSPNGTEYVFKLREGVKSPYGNELTSDDVVWGWQKSIAQKRTGSFIAEVSNVQSVEAVSKYEVKFTLSAPSEIFLRALATYVPSIYDSKEVKTHATPSDPWALKWMETHAAGYGAYHLESLVQGQQAVFVANPNYFGDKPFFTRVIYREIPSPAARLQLIKARQIHWAEDLTQQQILDLMKDRNFNVIQDIGTVMANVRMNANVKPFDDIRVRQALAYATDYDAINRAVFAGQGQRVRSLLPPPVPGNDPSYYKFETDFDKANQLLAAAGYPNGIDITITYGDELWFEEALAIQLRQSFAKGNIRLTLEKKTNAELRAGTAIGRRDIVFFPFRDSPFVLDPFYKLYIDAHPDGASNRNGFNNAEFTAVLSQGLREGDPAKRLGLAKLAQKIHSEQVSWLYILYPGYNQPMPKCIKGYTWYPEYVPRWRELSCR
jgi:peptide/nickel transport system substrate-binding protein